MFGPAHECGAKPLANTLFELQKAAGVAAVDLGTFVPDVVHAHDYRAIVGAEALAYRYNAALVVTKHSMHPLITSPDPDDPRRVLFYRYVDELQREGFARARAIILPSEDTRASVSGYSDELDDGAKVRVIPNGVDIPDHGDAGARAPGRIVFIGRLDPAKGAALLLDALDALDEDTASSLDVHIYGRGSLAQSLEQHSAQLRTRARITFHEFVAPERVPDILSGAELCVVPSRHDVYPLVTLEAMAAATPVIATKVGGIPSQLGHGERGLLVECDVQSLADGISYAISHRCDMAAHASIAREWVARNCSWDEIAARTAALYRDILSV